MHGLGVIAFTEQQDHGLQAYENKWSGEQHEQIPLIERGRMIRGRVWDTSQLNVEHSKKLDNVGRSHGVDGGGPTTKRGQNW